MGVIVSGVYVIRRRADGMCYVGSAVSVRKRWNGHMALLTKGRHHAPHLQHSWNKHGSEAHEFVLIEECSRETLLAREQHYINLLSPAFNVARIAGSRRGVAQPRSAVETTRRKNTGQKRSAETRAKMSAWQKGTAKPSRVVSLETKRRIGDSLRGRRLSEGTRNKLRAIATGRRWSLERRAAFAEYRRGKQHSAETKAKMSAALIGNTRARGKTMRRKAA